MPSSAKLKKVLIARNPSEFLVGVNDSDTRLRIKSVTKGITLHTNHIRISRLRKFDGFRRVGIFARLTERKHDARPSP